MEVITWSVALQGRASTRKVQQNILFNASSTRTKYDIFRQWTRDEFEGLLRTSRLQGNAICGIWGETSLKNHPPSPGINTQGQTERAAGLSEVQRVTFEKSGAFNLSFAQSETHASPRRVASRRVALFIKLNIPRPGQSASNDPT